ncbi:MAG TPA: hypothetical protein VIK18_06910 [Pirellulales bacterium]
MATTFEEEAGTFVISKDADSLLSHRSRDIAKLLSRVAAHNAKQRSSGLPLVTTKDVEEAVAFVYRALQQLAEHDLSPGTAEVVAELAQLLKPVETEGACASVGTASQATQDDTAHGAGI